MTTLLLALALNTAPPPAPEARFHVSLWTIDQGDEVYEMFGHNAIVIEDRATGQTLAWNWGIFNFDDVDFIPRFLRGTMRYTMGPAYADDFLESYRRADRTVYRNELLLTEEEAAALDAFVRWNYRPENRPYIYDYFRDNCSTRVRDALDGVLGGALRAHYEGPETARSYRWHARRLVQGTAWVDQGLSFLLGTRGDVPITEWEAMFVPMEVMRLLEDFRFISASGETRVLLGPREVLFRAPREPAPQEAPRFSFLWILAGAVAGGAVFGLGRASGTGRGPANAGFLLLLAVWGIFSGILGALLVSAWFTDHHFIHRNVNLLYLSPLALLLAPLALIGLARGARRPGRRLEGWTFRIGAAVAAGSGVALLAQLTGLVTQGNAEVIAVALPLNLAFAFGLARRAAPDPELAWDEIAAGHRDAVARLVEAAEAVPRARWHTARAEGKWSPAEVMEHLILGYEVVTGELRGRPGMELRTRPWQRLLLHFTYRRRILGGKGFPAGARAPREVRPRKPQPVAESDLEEAVDRFRARAGEFIRAIDEARRTRPEATVTNAYFGSFSLEEAYRFVAHHLDHHRPQL